MQPIGNRPWEQVPRIAVWRVLAIAAAFACALGMVMVPGANADVFSVFSSDPNGSCSITDTQPGSMTVYVYHRSPMWDVGATGAAFRLGSGGGFAGVLESVVFSPAFLALGNVTDSVQVSYTECINDDTILVATVSYSVSGTSPPCSYIEVLPFSEGGVIETYNCAFEMEPATASTPLIVNYDVAACGPLWCVSSTEATTWGAVKALYR